jgi:hypothetical protein
MRGMAGKASFFTDHRGMIERYSLAFSLVAVRAEGVDWLENQLRVLRGMRLMAGDALSSLKGPMFDISTRL